MTIAEAYVKIGGKVDKQSLQQATNTFAMFKNTLAKLAGAIGIGLSLKAINAIAEEFMGINTAVNYVWKELENTKEVQQGILDSANETRTSYANMAQIINTLHQSNAELFPLEDAIEFSETTQKLLLTAGKTQDQAATLQKTIGNMLSVSKVEATSLAALTKQAPEFVDTLAKSLDVSVDKLYEMADAGEVTADTIKESMRKAATDVDLAFNGLDYKISDALLNIRNQWGFWVDDMNSSLHLTDTISKGMVRGFSLVVKGLDVAKNGVVGLTNFLGGTENLLKSIAIVGGAVFLALKLPTIIDGIKKIWSIISSIKGSTWALVGILVAIALIVDDFINFMKGNDSVIGYAFEKAGIDADLMREKIKNIWENLKTFFKGIWEAMKTAAAPVIDWIKEKLEAVFGDDLFASLGNGLAGVIEFLERLSGKLAENKKLQEIIGKIAVAIIAVVTAMSILIPVVSGIMTLISGVSAALTFLTSPIGIAILVIGALVAAGIWLYKNWDTVKAKAIEIWGAIKDFFSNTWNKIKGFFVDTWNSIKTSVTDTWNSIKEFFSETFASISDVASTFGIDFGQIWDSICATVDAFMDILKACGDFINSVFAGDWEGAWIAIQDIFKGIWDGLVAFWGGVWQQIINVALTFLESIWTSISDTFNTIKDFFSEIWETIKTTVSETFQNIWDTITQKVSDIATTIQEGFQAAIDFITSLPGQALQWGADIINNIAQGIRDAIDTVTDAVSGVAENIKSFLHFSVPDQGPLADMQAWMPDMMNNIATGITQNASVVESAVQGMSTKISASINQAFVKMSGDISKSWKSSISVIRPAISQMTAAIKTGMTTAVSATKSSANNMLSVFRNAMSAMSAAATNGMAGVRGAIGSLANVFNSISSLAANAYRWGRDMGMQMAAGINASMGAVRAAVGNITKEVHQNLHFSQPDKGPLADFNTWMPDMMQGLAKGINDNRSLLAGAIAGVAGDLSALANAGRVNNMTAAYGSTYNNRSVSQNVNINNTFNGERAFQRNAERTMNRATDSITSELARALAYAR